MSENKKKSMKTMKPRRNTKGKDPAETNIQHGIRDKTQAYS